MKSKLGIIFFVVMCNFSCKHEANFIYKGNNLSMIENEIIDSLRTISHDSLPIRNPENKFKLEYITPLTSKLWNIALTDIESNIVNTGNGKYFGAGKYFGLRIYTRDISYSGILGLNELYPREMLSSLQVTRDVRLRLGLHVAKNYIVPGINAEWKEDTLSEGEFLKKYHTNSYTRRTDDIVWLWAARDLFHRHPDIADWQWMYVQGNQCFERLYWPFFDENDGLFRAQASFVDIHYKGRKTTGYPREFSITDCVLIKPLSTNCLYFQGMKTMAKACKKLGKKKEAVEWEKKAASLKQSILTHLKFEDGTFSYFKHQNGTLEPRREALGSALAVISGVVQGKDAKKSLAGYPVTWAGVPIFHPFYPWDRSYHNNTAWPYVDTFFLWAKEISENKDYTSLNAALLARTCVKDGSFHEVVNWKSKEPHGSGSQLWSASAFVNVCERAGLVR